LFLSCSEAKAILRFVVSSLVIEFQERGLHLPQLSLWMDPDDPHLGPEKVFISHAHSDHIAAHREVILSAPTARLMQARIPGTRHEHVMEFGERRDFSGSQGSYQLTLLPAGHIFGSAMGLVEADDESLLYTGDFKLRPGLSAEKCEPRRADILVMETTFGQPQYVFPPTREVLKGVVRFCREALDNEETPVLLGYSLGKSQELLCSLGEAGLPLMLHGTIYSMTQIYEQFGQCFPKYARYEAGAAKGKVLLCPPHVVGSAMVRNLGKARTAILTGWAVDPNCRYRYQCDAAFPLSDHADFPDLLELVKQVCPKRVYTLHGFAADFARTLRGMGVEARALSQDEQLLFSLNSEPRPAPPVAAAAPIATRASIAVAESAPGTESFAGFARTCAQIASDAGKLEKIRVLSDYLRLLDANALNLATTWFTGRPFPANQNKVLQLGWALIQEALSAAAGVEPRVFHQVYLKHSDLGETAAELLENRVVEPQLSIIQVGELFNELHGKRGRLAKAPVLRNALDLCTALEAKYLVKIITGDLRIGLKEGLVEDAIAAAFLRTPEAVRQANLLVGDIGETARLAAADRLSQIQLVPFRPIKFMLASPEETATDVWNRVQESAQASLATGLEPGATAQATKLPADPVEAWIEDKYDGVRCQLHKVGTRVALYSRDLKDITSTFPEIAEAVTTLSADVMLDGELVGLRGDTVLPFSELQRRLGRREADLFMREEVPIGFVAFDCLWKDGVGFLDRPLSERRATLESLAPRPSCLRFAQLNRTHTIEEIENAFADARSRGNEGLMIKDPLSRYSPGRRGLAWLKLKKALATLDCVVVGAEYGHGKRSKVLSDYTFAVRDEDSAELKIIGKAYSGLTDNEIGALTEHFMSTAIRRRGRFFEVPPDTVLEIAFDRIQVSERHSSGLAMRFPRIVRIRGDKSPAEIDTLQSARRLVTRGEPVAKSK
jgi:DNA ligase 1